MSHMLRRSHATRRACGNGTWESPSFLPLIICTGILCPTPRSLACSDVDDSLVLSALKRYARHMAIKGRVKPGLVVPDAAPRDPGQLAELESAAKCLDLYLWLARRFPREFGHLEAAQAAALKTQRLIEQGLRSIGAEALEEARRRRDLIARKGDSAAAAGAGAGGRLSSLFSADDDALEAALLHGGRGAAAAPGAAPSMLQGVFRLRGTRVGSRSGEGSSTSPGPRVASRFERMLKKLEQRAFAAVRPHLQTLQADASPALGALDELTDDGGLDDIGYSSRQRDRAARAASKAHKKGKPARIDPQSLPGFEAVGQSGPRYEGDMQALANGLRRVMLASMRRAGLLDDEGRLTRKALRGKKAKGKSSAHGDDGNDGAARGGFAVDDEDMGDLMYVAGDRAFGGLPRGQEVASIIKQLHKLKGKAMAARQREEAGRSGWRRPGSGPHGADDSDDDDGEDLDFAHRARTGSRDIVSGADISSGSEDDDAPAVPTRRGSLGSGGRSVDGNGGADGLSSSEHDASDSELTDLSSLVAEMAASHGVPLEAQSGSRSRSRLPAAVMSPAVAAAFGLNVAPPGTVLPSRNSAPSSSEEKNAADATRRRTSPGSASRSPSSSGHHAGKRVSILDAPLAGLPVSRPRGPSNCFR